MENHRLIEILELVKQNLINNDTWMKTGICVGIRFLHNKNKISLIEYYKVSSYLRKNEPTKTNQYQEFTNNEYWTNHNSLYWWKPIHKEPNTRQIRIDYLTALISNVK